MFDLIYKITTELSTLRRITREMIEDAAADGFIYLEIRTTPKTRPAHGGCKAQYVKAVLAGIADYRAACLSPQPCITNLLLSIDRRETAVDAQETVELAGTLRERGVVGIDLSGDFTLGSFSQWRPALLRARALQVRTTLHAAEMPHDSEFEAMLKFRPDRLGHVCFLSPRLKTALHASGLPVQLCLTSNVVSRSAPSYSAHHFWEIDAAKCHYFMHP